jgi:predicted permease
MKLLDALRLDIRYSIRRLLQSPGLSLAIIFTSVLVLTANATIFSLLDAVVLRKVAVSDPDTLVAISFTDARSNSPGYAYLDTVSAFRSAQRSMSHLSMYNGGGLFRIELENGEQVDAGTEAVSPDYFDLVRVRAVAGRVFTDADDRREPTMVVSNRLAARLFAEPAHAVGKSLKITGRAVAIAGVLEPGFTGLAFDGGADVFMGFHTLKILMTSTIPGIRSPQLVGRLAPGSSIDAARAELDARWPAIQAATIDLVPAAMRASTSTQRVQLESAATGFSTLRRQYGSSLAVLMGLAVVLLGIGAVNLSGLLLARGLARHHQFAVQRALGASPARLLRQSILDGVLLALAGLVVALPIAWTLIGRVEPMLMARALPLQQQLTPTPSVLAIAAITTVMMGVLIGVLPARRALAADAVETIRAARSVARGMGWAGRGVLITQIALAMVLVTTAGWFVTTLVNLYANDSSTRTRPIVWTRISPRPGIRPAPTEASIRALVDRLSAAPAVDRAVLSFYYPAYLGFPGVAATTTIARGGDDAAADSLSGIAELVTPGFFDLFGIAHLRGRDIEWTDSANSLPVGVISESVAKRLFPSSDPIGEVLQVTTQGVATKVTIVGIVANAPIGRIDEPEVPVVFRPMLQEPARGLNPIAHVRVSGDLSTASDGYVAAVNSLGTHMVRALFTMDEWVDGALLQQRLVVAVSGAAAAIAMLLAAVGVFGALAYSVTARMREIGIRISVGATQSSVLRMVMREGGVVIGAGVVIGGVLTLGAMRLVRSLLYGVSSSDPRTLLYAAMVFVLVGVAASMIPAVRASRVDPMQALRHE